MTADGGKNVQPFILRFPPLMEGAVELQLPACQRDLTLNSMYLLSVIVNVSCSVKRGELKISSCKGRHVWHCLGHCVRLHGVSFISNVRLLRFHLTPPVRLKPVNSSQTTQMTQCLT
uniref:Uncharacterized protein n=1 Tax=Anguilla anguilla TaxID=7936 RepID=A0A0E9W7B5_ANGAN